MILKHDFSLLFSVQDNVPVYGTELPTYSTTMPDCNTPRAALQDMEKRTTCKYCGKRLGSFQNCQRHERIHTGERPYGCRFCAKSFNQEGTRKAHERIHTGEAPFTCTVCQKGHKQRTHLRRHMMEKHGTLP